MSIERLLAFTKFLNKFRDVKRLVYFSSEPERPENDAEHSRQLAMLAWYMIDRKKIDLSLEKVLQYCLVHDLPEIYAGDVSAVWRTDQQQIDKEQKEHQAIERIASEFPDMDVMSSLHSYQQKSDAESRFVYALDKLIPMMNAYNDNWFVWNEESMSLEALIDCKVWKIDIDPTVSATWDELLAILEEERDVLFPHH
jgi:5'-deoxynucleotidase YfbR-like HD superfamily hydrolase